LTRKHALFALQTVEVSYQRFHRCSVPFQCSDPSMKLQNKPVPVVVKRANYRFTCIRVALRRVRAPRQLRCCGRRWRHRPDTTTTQVDHLALVCSSSVGVRKLVEAVQAWVSKPCALAACRKLDSCPTRASVDSWSSRLPPLSRSASPSLCANSYS